MEHDCCKDVKDLVEKYKSCSEGPALDGDDYLTLAKWLQSTKSCKCNLKDASLLRTLQAIFGHFIDYTIECLNSISFGNLKAQIQNGGNYEKIFQALSKLFQGQFYFYQACKQMSSALQAPSDDQFSVMEDFCNVSLDEDSPSYLYENVCAFCKKGGLAAIGACFDAGSEVMPLMLANCLIVVVAQLRLWLSVDATLQQVKPLMPHVIKYLCALHEDQLRLPSQRSMADLIIKTVHIQVENETTLDRETLELALKYFMSSTLTIRMAGLNQITNQIHNLVEMSHSDAFGDLDGVCQDLGDWLIENELIEHLFGPNHHIELLKQSQFILNFLAQERKLKPQHLDCIWATAQLKHAGKFVLDLLMTLTKHMDLRSVKFLLELIKNLPLSSHNKQTLFIASLLIRHVWSAQLSKSAAPNSMQSSKLLSLEDVMRLRVEKTVTVSPVDSSPSRFSDGSTDEEMASINAKSMEPRSQHQNIFLRINKAIDQQSSMKRTITVSPEASPGKSVREDPMRLIANQRMSSPLDDDNISCTNTNGSSSLDRGVDMEDFDDEVHLMHQASSPKSPSVDDVVAEEFDPGDLCNPGQTLLWDLAQDEAAEELADGLLAEVQRLLWQLVCYSGSKSVRMAFIKGCIDNIRSGRSEIVALHILPKILAIYPHPSNTSESQWLLEWSSKDLHMVDVFFDYLRQFVTRLTESLPKQEGHSRLEEVFQMVIQLRLEFLTNLYSQEISPDHFRLTIAQIDCLWDCLIMQLPDYCHGPMLNWLNRQANTKELHALGLDSFKHIFINKLPLLNPESFTLTGLNLFQKLFSLTMLSNASPFSQVSHHDQIPGIEQLWSIALNARLARVTDEAMGYLNYLYIIIGEGSAEKEQEFLTHCITFLKQAIDTIHDCRPKALHTIQQTVAILKSHIEAYQKRFAFHIHMSLLGGSNLQSHQRPLPSGSKDQLLQITCQPAGFSEKASFNIWSCDVLAKLRAHATHWCIEFQRERDRVQSGDSGPFLKPPFRLISHGHELTNDLDQKTLGELGMKTQQIVFVSVALHRKERNSSTSHIPPSLLPPPPLESSVMLQLLSTESFSQIFHLLDIVNACGDSLGCSSDGNKAPMSNLAMQPLKQDCVHIFPAKDLVHSIWQLLMVLPSSKDMCVKLKALDFNEGSSEQSSVINWGMILDVGKEFKLLYALQMIDAMSQRLQDILLQQKLRIPGSEPEIMKMEVEEESEMASEELLSWSCDVVQRGGLQHLYDLFMTLTSNLHSGTTYWTLDCLSHVIKLLTRFGCVERAGEKAGSDQENVFVDESRKKPDKKSKKLIFRSRYRSTEGENLVIIQRLNQTCLKLIDKEKFLDALLRCLCHVSSSDTPVSAGNKDVKAAVVYHTLSCLLCWAYSDECAVKPALTSYANFSVMLKRLLFVCPQRSVRLEASRGFYKMCISGSTSILGHVLSLLLDMLPDIVAAEGTGTKQPGQTALYTNYKDFFWLLCRLLDKYRPENDATELDVNVITVQMSELLLSHDDGCSFRGTGNQMSDCCLVGLLQACTSLLRHDTDFKGSSMGQNLLKTVYHNFLFDVNPKTFQPHCETKAARMAGYELLEELVTGCEINFVELQRLLLLDHTTSKQTSLHSSYGWNYWPHDLERASVGYVGLVNLSATCYMASCIQQVFMIPKFRQLVLTSKVGEDTKHSGILRELQKMFTFLQESCRKAYNPRSFCKTYVMDKQPLSIGGQEDMAEFFTDLVTKMEDMGPDLRQMVRESFCGVITNNVVSLDCPHVSKTEEEFYSVRSPVEDMKNLCESLDEVTVKNILEGDNKYTCSQCGSVRAEKRACFKTLPTTLCFNTLRYTFNMVTMMREKVNTHFSFPMKLNMAPYMEEYLMDNGDSKDPETDDRYRYNLVGVVVHTGTAEGGHYYSFIRDRCSKASANWFLFNDAEVKCFDPSQIAAECFGGEMTTKTYDSVTEKYMDFSFDKTHSAYMLFYEHSTEKPDVELPVKFELSEELRSWIQDDNKQFARDKLIFDPAYFAFMWQLCNSISRTMEDNPQVRYFTVKLGVSFLLETFVHSLEKPHIKGWVELLLRGLEQCQAACEWFLDNMAKDDWWTQQLFVKCNTAAVRQVFLQLCLQAVKVLRPAHCTMYSDVSDNESDDTEARRSEVGSCCPTTRFVRTLLVLLEEVQKPHCKNLGELSSFLYQFASLGQEECNFLLNVDTIASIISFYMGLKMDTVYTSGDDDDEPELDEHDIMSLFPDDKFNPGTLEKLISLIALLVEKSRENNKLRLSSEDCAALLGGRGLPFLFQIIKDAVNVKQTARLVLSLSLNNDVVANAIVNMVFSAVQKLSPDQCQPFFKLLSFLVDVTQASSNQPSFTPLILAQTWQAAECNAILCIEWLTSQVPKNALVHEWVLANLDMWVERYLIRDGSSRVMTAASHLLMSLIPNISIPQAFRSHSLSSPQEEMKMPSESREILHTIFQYLLNLMPKLTQYCDAATAGTSRLVTYFAVLDECLVSVEEKKLFTKHSADLWSLFHPQMSEPDIAMHYNKEALLAFWYHACTDCEANIAFITDTPDVASNIAYNYILSNDDQEVIAYNRSTLPSYYGLLRLACQHSKAFARDLSMHPNMFWAFEHLTTRINQCAQAVEELFNLLQMFAGGSGEDTDEEDMVVCRQFKKKAIALYSSSAECQSAWTTLITAFKILLHSEEDCLIVAVSKGLQGLAETFSTLHLMYHEATACNVVSDVAEILNILFTILNCCHVNIDRPEVCQSLMEWVERVDVMHKLLSMLNSFAPREIRKACTELLSCLLVMYVDDCLEVAVPVIHQAHMAARSVQMPDTPGPHFPLPSGKQPRRKLSMCQTCVPELNMTLYPAFIDPPRGVDEAYDLAITDYFYHYHQFVDKLCRYGLNLDRIPLSIIEISCLLAIEGIPLKFQFFANLWFEVYKKSQEKDKYQWCISQLVKSELLVEYLVTLLINERESLNVNIIYTFCSSIVPKVNMDASGDELQALLSSVTDIVAADSSIFQSDCEPDIRQLVYRINGNIHALCLLLKAVSEFDSQIVISIDASVERLVSTCKLHKERLQRESSKEDVKTAPVSPPQGIADPKDASAVQEDEAADGVPADNTTQSDVDGVQNKCKEEEVKPPTKKQKLCEVESEHSDNSQTEQLAEATEQKQSAEDKKDQGPSQMSAHEDSQDSQPNTDPQSPATRERSLLPQGLGQWQLAVIDALQKSIEELSKILIEVSGTQ